MGIEYLSPRNGQTDSNSVNTRKATKHRKIKRTNRDNCSKVKSVTSLSTNMPSTTVRSNTGMQFLHDNPT